MSSFFLWHKSDAVFSLSQGGDEAVIFSSTWSNDLALDIPVRSVHVEQHGLGHIWRHWAVGHIRQPNAFSLIGRGLNVNLNV